MAYLYRNDRQTMLAGLHWQYVTQSRTRALRVLARNENASHFVAIPATEGDGALLGCARTEGLSRLRHTPHALALCILPALKSLGDDGIAIFALDDDIFWFVALNQGELSVLSDITGSREHILQTVAEFGRFHTVIDGFCIAPDGFTPDHPAVIFRDLGDMWVPRRAPLQQLRRTLETRLRPVSPRKNNIRLIAALLVSVGVWLGWQHWQTIQTQRQDALARAALQRDRQSKNHPIIKPWQTQPSPAAFISGCSRLWDRQPLSIAGWAFSVTECGPDGKSHVILMARYRRPKHGTVGDFSARLPVYYNLRPEFDIPGEASTAQFIQRVPGSPPKKDDSLTDTRHLLQTLTSYAQQLHASLTLRPQTQPTALSLPYRSWAFSLKTDIPPTHLFPSSLPGGIRISKISVSLTQARLHYVLLGELYATP